MNTLKITLGALFLFVSAVTTLETGLVATRTPFLVAAIGSLFLALGSITFGTVAKFFSI